MKRLSTEEIKKRLIEKHGDRYDYSKVLYINRRTKIELICKTHGSFFMLSEHILRNQNCPKCSSKTAGLKKRTSLESFISRAKAIHGNKYD